MSDYSDYEDPAWEEYLSTGKDPTGGDLDVDETLYEKPRQAVRPKTEPKVKPVPANKEKQGPRDFSGIGCLLWIIVGIIWWFALFS